MNKKREKWKSMVAKQSKKISQLFAAAFYSDRLVTHLLFL